MKKALAIIIVVLLGIGMLVTTFAPLFTQSTITASPASNVQVQAQTAPTNTTTGPAPANSPAPTQGLPTPY